MGIKNFRKQWILWSFLLILLVASAIVLSLHFHREYQKNLRIQENFALSTQELTQSADLIVRGTAIDYELGFLITEEELTMYGQDTHDWTVQVEETLKGTPEQALIVRTIPLRLAEIELELQPKQEYLLFLADQGDGTYSPIRFYGGIFYQENGQWTNSRQTLSLEELKAKIN